MSKYLMTNFQSCDFSDQDWSKICEYLSIYYGTKFSENMHFKILVYESNGAKKLSRLVSLIKTSHEHLYVLQVLQTNSYEIAFVKISVVTIEIFFERNSQKLTNKIRSFSFKIVANFDAFSTSFSTSFSRKFLLNFKFSFD